MFCRSVGAGAAESDNTAVNRMHFVDRGKSMTLRLKKAVLLLTCCALLTLTGCTSAVRKDYQAAEALLEEGKYQEASVRFQELGSYEDASRLLMYSRAALAAENGDYDTARLAFSALGGFRDAPEMLCYYDGRESEAAGRDALSAGDSTSAVWLLTNAADIYRSLPAFRDAEQRGADCLGELYGKGLSLLDTAQYAAARDVFAALGSLEDSAQLKDYCEACLLEADGTYMEAAERFSALSGLRDADARADTDRELLYQLVFHLADREKRHGTCLAGG